MTLDVAVDVTPLLGARTGVGHFVAGLLDGLARREDIDVAPWVLSRRASLGDAALPAGTRRLRVPASLALRLWGSLGWPALDGRLGGAAVVHGTNFVVPPSRRRGLVVTVHDTGFARFPELTGRRARAFHGVVRRAVRRGAWVHTPTRRVADEVRELFGTEQVEAVPHGVPPVGSSDRSLLEAKGLPAHTPFVLVLGALEPRKRPALAVEAFGLLGAELHDVRLVVAGPDGPARGDVDSAMAALDEATRGRVHVLGRVTEAERATLLREAALLLHVSRYEGFGLPVLEAMSVGTPVVAGRDQAVAEVAGDAVRWVEEGGDDVAHGVADGLTDVLANTATRDRLVAAGRERAETFDWDATARGLVELYERAAES